MTAHPNRSRGGLAQYGARVITVDGRAVVESVNPNDNGRRRYQYRRTDDGGLECRVLLADGRPDRSGSPWVERTQELASMRAMRGPYHPILDALGL